MLLYQLYLTSLYLPAHQAPTGTPYKLIVQANYVVPTGTLGPTSRACGPVLHSIPVWLCTSWVMEVDHFWGIILYVITFHK